jgi:hypothetical protein
MKNEPWKPAGLQKFNEFCMAVNEDRKSPVGQKFKEEYQQKALNAGKKLHKRKACFTATITMYLDVEGESTSSSMASVESSQRATASSAAAPRTQQG